MSFNNKCYLLNILDNENYWNQDNLIMLHTNQATKHYNAKGWIFGDKVQSLYNDFLFLKLIISK